MVCELAGRRESGGRDGRDGLAGLDVGGVVVRVCGLDAGDIYRARC